MARKTQIDDCIAASNKYPKFKNIEKLPSRKCVKLWFHDGSSCIATYSSLKIYARTTGYWTPEAK